MLSEASDRRLDAPQIGGAFAFGTGALLAVLPQGPTSTRALARFFDAHQPTGDLAERSITSHAHRSTRWRCRDRGDAARRRAHIPRAPALPTRRAGTAETAATTQGTVWPRCARSNGQSTPRRAVHRAAGGKAGCDRCNRDSSPDTRTSDRMMINPGLLRLS
jgi:hypothetical protein